MRNKEKMIGRIIDSMEKVDITFKLLSDERQIDELNKGIYLLMDKLGSEDINLLFDRYPRLIQKYSLKEMFSGNIEIPNIDPHSLKIAGLLTCLQFLVSSFTDFIDEFDNRLPLKETETSNSYQAEHYIISSIALDDYLKELFLSVLSVTGEEYYQKFLKKIGNPDFTIDDILKLDKDKELQEHIDLLMWYSLIRVFLEAIYFYLNIENHNSKI
ncbi:Uncharacterised protein [Chryseobacterium nakagawai]|uniref:Uncharacterized protein n=1 Tax=Chryseobacterium nakagawai TaxID=1241982 RepID=A0AAD0YKW2_CHRNA|nr:hypothetical protein [Chryseobacterium nakagawai]AZA92381.1 hypothetical protein EG343_18045 [Chryseobacterium nakagawai]VEH18944.1 Uncharacterised protein [Chryseobacterium nakagawai]